MAITRGKYQINPTDQSGRVTVVDQDTGKYFIQNSLDEANAFIQRQGLNELQKSTTANGFSPISADLSFEENLSRLDAGKFNSAITPDQISKARELLQGTSFSPVTSDEFTKAIEPPSTGAQNTPQAPTDPLGSIRKVFGPDFQPAPAFKDLQSQGIYGAVRIEGMNDVFTIGPGGRKETAESYQQRFGTAEQQGIVGEITAAQARALGINMDEALKAPTVDDIGGGPTLPSGPKATESLITWAQNNLPTYQGIQGNLDAQRKRLDDLLTDQRSRLEEEMTASEAKIEGLEGDQKSLIENEIQQTLSPFREELEKTERERLKVEENFFANQNTVNEMTQLLTDIQAQVEAAKGVTGWLPYETLA